MAFSTYHVSFMITEDSGMRLRVAACAQEQALTASKDLGMAPEQWAEANRWKWAVSPGWSGKVQYALDSGVETWGLDPGVITDSDILSAIQPLVLAIP